jgi:hypothetical protein
MTRPSNNNFTVSITNSFSNLPLVNTDSGGTAQSDMTAWQMCIEFFPITSSLIQNIRFQNT